MITTLYWWNTLNHEIPKVCVQRERKRQIGTHFFQKNPSKKNKKNTLLPGHRVGVPCCLLSGFPSKLVLRVTCMKVSFHWMWETYSDMDLEINLSATYYSQTDMDLEID